ncbi:hypothetical protein [Emticicia fluvialis]|uniref:hypothetical protein n=1 Tax=Emticicia fluvialis TaxID=2974474 RepID=UPI0021659697|nr:hypothetical protein [Emticicia fluvialis]
MKALLISILFLLTASCASPDLTNSVWICTIDDRCTDTLKFESNNRVTHYSCQMNYTFKSTFDISKNVVTISVKDESREGKPEYARLKYHLGDNELYPISNEELVNGKWIKPNAQLAKKYIFKRSK